MVGVQIPEGQGLAVNPAIAEQGFTKRPATQPADAVPGAAQTGIGQNAMGKDDGHFVAQQ